MNELAIELLVVSLELVYFINCIIKCVIKCNINTLLYSILCSLDLLKYFSTY